MVARQPQWVEFNSRWQGVQWINFVVGVAHLQDYYSIKQGISSANALPSSFSEIVVVVNRGGFGICGINPVNNEIFSTKVKPPLIIIDKRFFQNENH